MQTPWRAAAALALVATLWLTGCGDSDGDTAGNEAASDSDATTGSANDSEATEGDESGDTGASDDDEGETTEDEAPPDTAVPPAVGDDRTFITPFDDAPAAVVEGVEVSADALFSELSNQLAAQQASTGSTAASADTDGAVEANLASSVLSELIVSELAAQELDERGLSVDDDDLAAVREQIGEPPEGVDEEFVDNFVQRQAQYEALAGDLTDDAGDTSGLECSRHVLVETEEEALSVIERLEAGEDFTEVASEASTDPSAAQNGGALGCDVSSFVPPFAEAVQSLEVGERSDPVATDFGFHVIEKVEPSESDIEQVAQQARQTVLREWILERVESAEVSIDERIGTWDPVSGVVAIGTPDPNAPQIIDESLVDGEDDN